MPYGQHTDYPLGGEPWPVIRIPSDQSNPGYDVLGNELTNPGGFVHNGAESKIIGADAALIGDDLWHNGSAFVARTRAEILANNDDTDRTRSSYDNKGNIIDILPYPTAPTGDDLTQLNNFLDSRHP